MTEQEKKAWEEMLHGIKYGCEEIITPYQNAILAADAELSRLRAIEERAKDVEGLAKCLVGDIVWGKMYSSSKEKLKRTTRAISAWITKGEG